MSKQVRAARGSDSLALEAWIAYAEKMDEAYQRPFVHFRLKDYLDYTRGAAKATVSVQHD